MRGIIAAIENPHAQAVGDDLLVGRSRLEQFVRQHVHLRVKSIAHDQAIGAVEHAQPCDMFSTAALKRSLCSEMSRWRLSSASANRRDLSASMTALRAACPHHSGARSHPVAQRVQIKEPAGEYTERANGSESATVLRCPTVRPGRCPACRSVWRQPRAGRALDFGLRSAGASSARRGRSTPRNPNRCPP